MIEAYESNPQSAAKLYAMGLTHKHLPEMKHVCGLARAPVFTPILVNTRQGMIVSVPLRADAEAVWAFFREYYKNAGRIAVMPFGERTDLELEGLNGGDNMEIYVFGHKEHCVLSARFDNLGKGSGGAAVQCMKVRMGHG
jgi:N-acetyl-gamma-glutamyl-phosphate reductase